MWIDYDEYMSSPEWQSKREQIAARCGGICEECKILGVFHVHHLTYKRFGNELLEDLQGLCFDCHQAKHPDKVLGDGWLTASDICKRLDIAVSFFKFVLKQEGLIEVDARNVDPTTKANRSGIVRKHRRKYKWNFEAVRQILKNHVAPKKHDHSVKRKPTKQEEYNALINEYGLSVIYHKRTCRWYIKRREEIIAIFSQYYGKYSARIVDKTESTEIDDGFMGVLRLLDEHKIISLKPEQTKVKTKAITPALTPSRPPNDIDLQLQQGARAFCQLPPRRREKSIYKIT